jgi:ABC-2 type transport system ATP-binding protein
MKNLVLKCDNLYKNFGKKEILKNVSFELHEGNILGFIGPNGAGKTTTIKLILGLQNITSGEVKINGYNIETEFTKAIERVGTIVENPDLYMYLSGYENLKLISKMYKGISKERIDQVIELVGLKNRIKDKVSKYSLGMRQRLGLAQAILHKPNLLILDEPTNGLDPEGIKEIRELLVKLAKEESMAVLISSHNLAELETLCNKVCIIKNGEIIETSDIEEIIGEKQSRNRIIEVNNTSKIKELFDNVEIISETHFKITVDKKDIPTVVKLLASEDILIYKIEEEEISLEDAFLKKTGGNIID